MPPKLLAVLQEEIQKGGPEGAIGVCREQGYAAVILVGDHEYYERFGFHPAGDGLLLETLRYEEELKEADDVFAGIGSKQLRGDLIEMAKELIERTAFAMAQQDVRYYLNGLLFDLREQTLRCVATDGHRLALCEATLEKAVGTKRQIIVPRKGVTELQRLLEGGDRTLELELGRSHIRVKRDDVTFTSKLIDGRFPDYEAVIPIGAEKEVKLDREVLRAALQRAAILSNEKYRGVRVEVSPGQLKINSHNPEQEEAQEEIEADTRVDNLAIGFNVNYLLEALGALRDEQVVIAMRDSNSSALVREASSNRCRHVVMPLRL